MPQAIRLLLLSAVGAGLCLSCAPAKIASAWKDPAYAGAAVKKVFVIGLAQRGTTRKVFEDEFVKALRDRGTNAVQSYRYFPPDVKPDRATMMAKIRELEADAVVVTRLVDRRLDNVYTTGRIVGGAMGTVPDFYGEGFHDYYAYIVTTPGAVVENETFLIESKLYTVAGERLLWSAMSESTIGGKAEASDIRFVARMLVDQLTLDKQGR